MTKQQAHACRSSHAGKHIPTVLNCPSWHSFAQKHPGSSFLHFLLGHLDSLQPDCMDPMGLVCIQPRSATPLPSPTCKGLRSFTAKFPSFLQYPDQPTRKAASQHSTAQP